MNKVNCAPAGHPSNGDTAPAKSEAQKYDYYPLKEHPNTYYSSVLQDCGIRIYLTAAEKRNVVKLIVNPRKLLDSKAG